VRQSLAQLIESVTVDAYGDAEQLIAFLTVFEEEVQVPCSAMLLDTVVDLLGFELEGDERRGIVTRCRLEGGRVDVASLADVRFESGRSRRGCMSNTGPGSACPHSPLGVQPAGAGRSRELCGQLEAR
jgi:hypothetical protein